MFVLGFLTFIIVVTTCAEIFSVQGVLVFFVPCLGNQDNLCTRGICHHMPPCPPVVIVCIIAVSTLILSSLSTDGAFIILVVESTVWANNYAVGAGARCMTVLLTVIAAYRFVSCDHDGQWSPLIYAIIGDYTEGQDFPVKYDHYRVFILTYVVGCNYSRFVSFYYPITASLTIFDI